MKTYHWIWIIGIALVAYVAYAEFGSSIFSMFGGSASAAGSSS